MYFYRLDPERVLHIPFRLLYILIEQLPALDAERMYNDAITASTPQMEDEHRESFFDALRELMEPLQPIAIAQPQPQIIEHNPEKARAYFAAMGLQTV